MILILLLLVYYTNIFGKQAEYMESSKKIQNSNYENIDNLDIKQLKNVVENQNQLIIKQKEVIDEYIDKIEKTRKKYTTNIIKPSEDIELYFEEQRKIIDDAVKLNEKNSEEDIMEKNQKLIKVVKRYLEDPVTRGYNIYESEQYSKLLEIGNIQINNKETPPNPSYWAKNIN